MTDMIWRVWLFTLDFWYFERKTYTWSSRKSSYFEIRRISWNLADFMKSSRFHMKSGSGFHVKSTQNLIKADVSTKTLQFGGCREGAMTQDFMKSWFIAPLLHSSNWIALVETFAFIRFWVDFTWNPPDFMKSKDHLQGIVTLCLLDCWWLIVRTPIQQTHKKDCSRSNEAALLFINTG